MVRMILLNKLVPIFITLVLCSYSIADVSKDEKFEAAEGIEVGLISRSNNKGIEYKVVGIRLRQLEITFPGITKGSELV